MKKESNRRLRVLHITPWYPHRDQPYQAVWIRQHIESLAPYADQFVMHLDIGFGKSVTIHQANEQGLKYLLFRIPTRRWFIFELCWFFFLFYFLILRRLAANYDIIQFHIAYPSLTYWHWLRRFVSTPVVVIEHWSAYHFNFGVKKDLRRVKRIFSQRIPLICVSKALEADLKAFVGHGLFNVHILPNVVDTQTFRPSQPHFTGEPGEVFMLSQWKWPKRPEILLRAFAKWNVHKKLKYILKIGGYGEQMEDMQRLIDVLEIRKQVKILGPLTPAQISSEMSRSVFFAHCSDYETFSVVCAEALCTGTPVIVSNVGGVREYITEQNGVLVEKNAVDAWHDAFDMAVTRTFDRAMIGLESHQLFSKESVGEKYYRILNHVADAAD